MLKSDTIWIGKVYRRAIGEKEWTLRSLTGFSSFSTLKECFDNNRLPWLQVGTYEWNLLNDELWEYKATAEPYVLDSLTAIYEEKEV